MGMAHWEEGKVHVLENATINQAFQVCKNATFFTLPTEEKELKIYSCIDEPLIPQKHKKKQVHT
jgi:hypothetical protein